VPSKESGEFDNSGSLEGLRARIDEIDDELVDLLNERAQVVISIAGLKRVKSRHGYDTRREHEIIGRVIERSGGPFELNQLTGIFITILDQSKELLYKHMRADEDGE